jgi:predicted hydrolase (HD superfamily)
LCILFHHHSVAVCTLMVNVARFIGRDEAEIRDFGLAGLLHDIGKSRAMPFPWRRGLAPCATSMMR